jgi:hypothetical protein
VLNSAQIILERLRKNRARPGREMAVGAMIASIAKNARQTHKKHGEFIGLWEKLVPSDLAAQTSIVSLRGGIVQVRVDSSAASFEIDRLLRTGLLAQLRSEFSGTLMRVKVKVGG